VLVSNLTHIDGVGRPRHVRHVEASFCECGTRFPDLADDGTIWHYLALLEGCPFSISNRINELRSYPVKAGTLFVATSPARSPTPFRPGRTTDIIVATPRRSHVALAILATKIARSARSTLRRWHKGSEDCTFAVRAIFAILVQSSRDGSNGAVIRQIEADVTMRALSGGETKTSSRILVTKIRLNRIFIL
jgi:hypothetical protein